jgi:hypothetical protein
MKELQVRGPGCYRIITGEVSGLSDMETIK